jgi:endonuclease YncB( thermonuclease family)
MILSYAPTLQEIDFGQFHYQCEVINIVDGDTFDADIDLGFSLIRHDQRIRLSNINTAEIHFVKKDSDEYRRGIEHKQFVESWLETGREGYEGGDGWPFVIATERDGSGSYGRYLAALWRKSDGTSLEHALLDEFGEDILY